MQSQLERILEKRKLVLKKADELVEICRACELRKPYTMDRKSPACDNCPTQAKIYKVRAELDKTMRQMKALRQRQ